MASRVTLEISDTDIRFMEVEEGKVIGWASRSLEPGIFEDGVISAPEALSTTVKELMISGGMKKNVIASVSGLYSLSRVVMVPNPTGGPVTQQAIIEVVSEVIPLSEEELYMSWQTVAPVEGGQHVLVIGVPRDVIDGEILALRAAGVKVRVLDLKAMALARAVNRERALILNIESTSFDIVVVAGGLIEIMRTTAWHQGDLNMEEKAEHLAVALELTVGFYNSHHPGFPFDPATPLFITGQMSGDLALVEELQARVGYAIEPLTPPLEYPEHLPVSQYAVNIGLALKGTALSKTLGQGGYSLPDINLLPQIYRPWKPSARQIYFLCSIIAAIALLFPIYEVTSEAMGKTALLQTRYDVINTELQRRQTELKKREPLQKDIARYSTIVDMGGGFTENLQVINSESEKLGIDVQKITHSEDKISVVCQADNYTAFRDYRAALEASGKFSLVNPPSELFPYLAGGVIELTPKSEAEAKPAEKAS